MKLSKSKFQEHQDTSAPQMLKVPFKKEGPEADADLRALHLRQLGALFEGKNIKFLSPLPRPWKGAIKLKELILRLHKKSTLSLKQKQHFSSNTYWETHKRPIYINFKPELCTAEQHHRTAHPRSSAHEVFVWMCPLEHNPTRTVPLGVMQHRRPEMEPGQLPQTTSFTETLQQSSRCSWESWDCLLNPPNISTSLFLHKVISS